jgi:hypothetical protein
MFKSYTMYKILVICNYYVLKGVQLKHTGVIRYYKMLCYSCKACTSKLVSWSSLLNNKLEAFTVLQNVS